MFSGSDALLDIASTPSVGEMCSKNRNGPDKTPTRRAAMKRHTESSAHQPDTDPLVDLVAEIIELQQRPKPELEKKKAHLLQILGEMKAKDDSTA